MKASKKIVTSVTPVSDVELPGAVIRLLGTAHVSARSVEDVRAQFKEWGPDIVCVELCQSRYEAMGDPDRWRKLDLAKVIREKKLALLVSNLILASFQKKIGDRTGVKPGAEMFAATELARDAELLPVLIDRDIRTTLKRVWGRVGFFSRMWLGSALFSSLLVREEVSPEEIERMKNEDVLADLFAQLPARYHSIKNVIIDERDRYMSRKLLDAVDAYERKGRRGKIRVLAVIGAGHLPGIRNYLSQGVEKNLTELESVPPSGRLKQLLSWFLFSAVLLLVTFAIGTGGQGAAKDALIAWVAGRSIGAGAGALIARAHPLTFLVTVVMAPISIFIAGTRLWMYSTLTELWLKKPRVEDFENIASDTETVSGMFAAFYKNRVLHIFWILFAVSTGLTIGNLVFFRTIIARALGGFM